MNKIKDNLSARNGQVIGINKLHGHCIASLILLLPPLATPGERVLL